MSIFSDTMKKSISVYRQILRKYLPQAERITKLNHLNLKNPDLYKNEVALYQTGYLIINDIEKNLSNNNSSYYSYSGIRNFSTHLKGFLQNYEIEDNHIIHRSQKASRALVQAIQLLTLPRNQLTDEIKDKLAECNKIIASFGSQEQHALHKNNLQNTIRRQSEQNTAFYRSVLHNFQENLSSPQETNQQD